MKVKRTVSLNIQIVIFLLKETFMVMAHDVNQDKHMNGLEIQTDRQIDRQSMNR